MKPLMMLLPLCAFLFWVEAAPQDSMDTARPGTLPQAEIKAMLLAPGAHDPFVPEIPLGLPADLADLIPADNPLTPAKVELGRQLYFDKRLSRDGTVSCATCHDPSKGWTDQAPVSTGIRGQKGGRSAPSVLNRLLGTTQFWDGRAATLEEQAVGPIANPIEMGFTHDEAVKRLNSIPGYKAQFEAVFDGPATIDRVGKAIAAFERTILSGNSKYDYWKQAEAWFDWDPEDEEDPEWVERGTRILEQERIYRMSPSAQRGRELFFGAASCTACHLGADFTDEQFHNIGVGVSGDTIDVGRTDHTGDDAHWGQFKTPGLRNIALTAPYMHAGSMQTLLEVVEHYNKGGTPNQNQSENIFELDLSEQEMRDLVNFMVEGLSGPVTPVLVPRLP